MDITSMPPETTAFQYVDIEDWTDSIEGTDVEIPSRTKIVLRTMFGQLRVVESFHSAQKLLLEAILKSLGPRLPEILTFQTNDIFVASRLVFMFHSKFASYAQKEFSIYERRHLESSEAFQKAL